jgi:hypothetical protein
MRTNSIRVVEETQKEPREVDLNAFDALGLERRAIGSGILVCAKSAALSWIVPRS